MRRALPWIVALAVLVLDRVTKAAILRCLPEGGWQPVLPGLSLTHVHNRGIAFSLFADGGPLTRVVLQLLVTLAVAIIAWLVYRHGARGLAAGTALGLILGGAAGNLVDRMLYGWVVDFIHLWVRIGDRTWSWPDFNVADSAITVGAVLLVLGEFRHPAEGANAPHPD